VGQLSRLLMSKLEKGESRIVEQIGSSEKSCRMFQLIFSK
jgi:hypothetical protein